MVKTFPWPLDRMRRVHRTISGGTIPENLELVRKYADGVVVPRPVEASVSTWLGYGGRHYYANIKEKDDYLFVPAKAFVDERDAADAWINPRGDNKFGLSGRRFEARFDEQIEAERYILGVRRAFFRGRKYKLEGASGINLKFVTTKLNDPIVVLDREDDSNVEVGDFVAVREEYSRAVVYRDLKRPIGAVSRRFALRIRGTGMDDHGYTVPYVEVDTRRVK